MSPSLLARHHRALLGVVAVALVLVVAAALARLGRTDPADDEPPAEAGSSARPSPAPSSGTAGAADDVPTVSGLTPDADGAVRAALAYTTASQGWLYLSDENLTNVVARLATSKGRDSLTAEVLEKVQYARARLADASGRIWWLVRPLAWRVERFAGDRAEVEVWAVGVLSATGVAAPQAEWSTLTFELVWSDDQWLIDVLRDRLGPTPMTGPRDDPWDADQLDRSLEGFVRVGEEAAS